MPTTKPRITVTLKPHAYEVLSRLSAVSGDSMSALLADLFEVSRPSLERLVSVLERAASAPEEARAGLAAAVERAERTVLPALMHAQGINDLFLEDIANAMPPTLPGRATAKPGRAIASGAALARKDPRLVTRGSGTSTGRGKGGGRG